jgi:hypothetical protein
MTAAQQNLTPSGQGEVIVGRDPTPEELELVTWAEEVIRKEPVIAGEGLRLLVTLNTALLAGSAAIIDKLGIPSGFKVAGVIFLIISLGVALLGSLPQKVKVDPRRPRQIKLARERSTAWKVWMLRLASIGLFAAMLTLVFGLVWGWFL